MSLSGKNLDVVVVGDCCPDIILTGRAVRPVFGQAETLVSGCTYALGGSGAIAACRLADLGLRVAFVSVIGDDLFGSSTREIVANHGVDVAAVKSVPGCSTGATVVLSEPGDRAMLTAPGTIELMTIADVPDDLVARSHHVHVSSFYLHHGLRPDLSKLLERARAGGASTSLDTNWDPAGRWDGLTEVLTHLDILFVNAAEAARLTDDGDPLSASRRLSAQARLAVVKCGADPAFAASSGRAWVASPPHLDVVDTIGAGDSFDAGFIAGWLPARSIPDGLAMACATGSLSTLGTGGTGGIIDPIGSASIARKVPVTEIDCIATTVQERS